MRFARSIREPIPWTMKQSPSFATWEWTTPHLSITIIGEGPETSRIFHWKIYDVSEGKRSMFDEGDGVSFNECVDQAIEIVAKSWPRHYDYSKYAGHLAYTFKIGEGSLVNFESLIGKECVLVVKGNDGLPLHITGSIDIKHYDIVINKNSQTIVIPPSRIMDIRSGFGKSLISDLVVTPRFGKKKTS